jgi:hypothetical protein
MPFDDALLSLDFTGLTLEGASMFDILKSPLIVPVSSILIHQ